MKNDYQSFLNSKALVDTPRGIEKDYQINPKLFPFQKACVRWALRRGRALLAEDCGLGKSFQQIEWARIVNRHTSKPVLILAPLAVAQQTIAEGRKLDVDITYARQQSDADKKGITIANYEMLHHFDPSQFSGIVLDESSILKNYAGAIRNQVIESFSETPFRLACTATPAPNDHIELGNHAEFLGALTRSEMLSTFFIHDGGDTSKWRLKGHAENPFWRWMASWALMIQKPSDIGFDDKGFNLPPLVEHRHILDSESPMEGYLFAMPATSLNEQRAVKRASIEDRVKACSALVNKTDGPWVVWGELNDECDALEQKIKGAVQVAGSDSMEFKEETLTRFSKRKHRVLVSKVSIAGFGLNWQHCANMAFSSITHSHEDQYQAMRRCLRYGQKKTVNVHLFLIDTETPILQNLERKQKQSIEMQSAMIGCMAEAMKTELGATTRQNVQYEANKSMEIPEWLKQRKNSSRSSKASVASSH